MIRKETRIALIKDLFADYLALEDNDQAEILNSMAEHFTMLHKRHRWELEMQICSISKKLGKPAKEFIKILSDLTEAIDE